MQQPNQRVGEYLLDQPMGQSAYAEVWRAHHHMWADQLAAVKIPTDPAYLTNLRKEGVIVHRLVHPSIVKPLGFDPNATPPYLISEFISGGSLRPWIAQRRISVPQSVNLLRQVLSALQFGHERNIVHGDIKPENILLEETATASDFSAPGSVKVTDFGVGLAANATTTSDANARTQASSSGLAYVAPEQRDGAAPDAKSDIYAVGIVLFEMLTGERPSGAELPSELNPNVPSWLDDAFRKSYARRERRFESAQSFLLALRSEGAGAAVAPAAITIAPAPVAAPARQAPAPTPIREAPAREVSGREVRPRPAPIQEPVAETETAEIGFRDEEEDRRAPEAIDEQEPVDLAPQPDEIVEPVEPEEPQPDELEADSPPPRGPGDTTIEPSPDEVTEDSSKTHVPAGPAGPEIPPISKAPSRADRDAIFDELSNRQLRSAEDVKVAFKSFVEARELDEGEAANIRIRLVKWANSLVGADADLDSQIILTGASARPVHAIALLTRTSRGDTPPKSQIIDHPAGDIVLPHLQTADYRLANHLSAMAIYEKLLEGLPSAGIRSAIIRLLVKMVRESRRELVDRMARQDLMIFRANVIAIAYKFDDQKYRAFLVGNSLAVVAVEEPFTRVRNEPTKRAATLLEGEQIQDGLKELRRALDIPQFQSRSGTMLNAVRGKLAAAYVLEAKDQFKSFGWLESLDTSAKAGQLVPGQEDALIHAGQVHKRTKQLHLLPGLIVTIIFIGCSIVWALQEHPITTKSFPIKEIGLYMVTQNNFFAAGMGALIATIWAWKKLGTRMARTDLTFYHAILLPTAIAGILAFAPPKFINPIGDAICGVLLALVIVADVLLFKYFRRYLLRQFHDTQIVGDEVAILNRVESMVTEDWERLKPHYLSLGPLYGFTSVQTAAPTAEALAASERPASAPAQAPPTRAAPPRAAPTTSSGDADKLVQQMNSRLSAAARNIAPPGRMIVTLINEYSKSVSNRQLGMMQSNAVKIEQKGKDLLDKLADYERLCRSPLTMDANASEEVREMSATLSARADQPDIQLLRSAGELAKTFRENQSQAVTELTAIVDEIAAAVERLKQA